MDRLRLEDLRAFVQVVEAGGVSEAGRRLGLSKSVISERVASLEQALEARLLRRSANRVEPTEKGFSSTSRRARSFESLTQQSRLLPRTPTNSAAPYEWPSR